VGRAAAAVVALVVAAPRGPGGGRPAAAAAFPHGHAPAGAAGDGSAAPAVPRAGCAAPPATTLRGDVDGDGAPDAVRLTLAARAARCTYALRAGDLRAVVTQPSATRAPALVALARIDASRGLEVVVRTLGGASVDTAAVFQRAGGRLVRVAGPRLVYGMGGGGASAVDCVGRGTGRVRQRGFSRAVQGPDWIETSLLDLELRGGAFVRGRAASTPNTHLAAAAVTRLAAVPFRACAVALAR
jgi:hypothetical protein